MVQVLMAFTRALPGVCAEEGSDDNSLSVPCRMKAAAKARSKAAVGGSPTRRASWPSPSPLDGRGASGWRCHKAPE